MTQRILNSDQAMEFVESPVVDNTRYEFGADPLEILIALEEQQARPMRTRVEPKSLRKSKVYSR